MYDLRKKVKIVGIIVLSLINTKMLSPGAIALFVPY